MPCVFCGRSPTTNEHVFPRWLNRYLQQGRRQQLEQARYGEDGFDVQYPARGLNFRVNRVCAPCNNGWMAQLEEQSIDVLHPLISTLDLQVIDRRTQRQVALWATKTAMVLDQTQAIPLVRPGQLARMRTHRAIPGGTRIWVGACAELDPLVTSHTVRIELENLDQPAAPWPVGDYAPMKLGHLCLYVYFPGAEVVVQHPGRYHLAVARIWPRRRGIIVWPHPARAQDGPAFEEIADRFWRELRLYSPDYATQNGLRES